MNNDTEGEAERVTDTRVAFQGERGANSEEAIRRYFGESVTPLPCVSFRDIFQAIQRGEARYGMLPVENALAGTVAQAYEMLMEYDFRVLGEYILPIQYCLMVNPGSKLEDIQRVRSHPQALAQCAHYIQRRGWEPIASYDTAGAARELRDQPDPHTAALASALAARLYDLTVLESNVEDEAYNSTRFFIIGREEDQPAQSGQGYKTSLIFTFRDKAGALVNCLNVFAERNINLTKLESRPVKGRAWQYWFYLDLEGHWNEPHVEAALVDLLRRASFVKMLGSYPAAQGIP